MKPVSLPLTGFFTPVVCTKSYNYSDRLYTPDKKD